MGYTDDLEPSPPDYEPHAHDLARCKAKKGTQWTRYISKPLQDGAVIVQSRGKEIILAAGYHAIRCHLGLEGIITHVRRTDYERIIAQDTPGSSANKGKAEKMLSFIIPPDLTIPEARHKWEGQHVEIFAAIVGQRDVFFLTDFSRMVRIDIMSLDRHWRQEDLEPGSLLWRHIWDSARGPDWTYEQASAEQVLDAFVDE
ncbi:hypothetical protein C8Q80DRAFT_1276440 [Daedaleopsis nitida]|nr:hypothetical protein C8Q80DRAFT_1276440 [Daedaleopsis nitida]